MTRRKVPPAQQPNWTWKQHIVGDLVVTFLWVVASAALGELSAFLDVQLPGLGGEFTIGLVLLLLLLLIFSPICNAFWGAFFNPVNNFALLTSGKGKPVENVLRMGAQVLGALAGSHAATKLIPEVYQGRFHANAGGLKSGAQLEHGFLCEVSLGLAASLLFLFSLDMKNKRLAFWLPLLATAVWCYFGSHYTGPSMNPGLAFSWNWHYQRHTPEEHIVVFWFGPFVGAGLAGLSYLGLTGTLPAGMGSKGKSKVGQARQRTRSSPRVRAAQEGTNGVANGAVNGVEEDVVVRKDADVAGVVGVVGQEGVGPRRRSAAAGAIGKANGSPKRGAGRKSVAAAAR